jgi:putative CocE/NonD family hydrolase
VLPAECIEILINEPAKMRDGTILYADIYRPRSTQKYPAIVARSPYDKSHIPGGYMDPLRIARSGYNVVIQDLRGTGASEGEFYPRIAEMEDGYDTIEWIARQPWCDGNVGMYGMSHHGFTQWAAAVTQPPHLKAICPVATYAGARPFNQGALRLNHLLAWASIFPANKLGRSNLPPEKKKELRDRLFQLNDQIADQYWQLPLKDVPTVKLAEEIDGSAFFYSDYLKHSDDENYWKKSCSPAPLENVTVPALHLVGWYDLSASGVLESYVYMTQKGCSALVRKNQKLIMGPWIHSADLPAVAGSLNFGMDTSGAAIDACGIHIKWFDYWLKGRQNGILDEPPVRIFILGENVWRDENEWPLARTRYTNFYFHSNGNANSRLGVGTLNTTLPDSEKSDTYQYDPADPVPSKPGKVGSEIIMGAFDYQDIEKRKDILVYTSEVLKTDLEVTGPVILKLYASTSAADTDFTGKLLDVWPDGQAYNLTDGIVRTQYRESEWVSKPIVPGLVYEYTIDLGSTSNMFKAGHQIRVEISSSNFPKWDRNLNTGHKIGEDDKMVVASQTIFHNPKNPSHIVLPVIPASP